MKKAILMITAALALLLGCNESLSLLTKITITSEVKEVYVGGTLQLTASVEPADVPEAVVWSSSDEKTATVDQKGVVTGVKEGTVTVKLASKADENMCGTVEITVVKNPNPVTVASVVIMDGETSLSEELTVKVEADENGAYTQEKAFQAVVNFSDGSEGRYDETVSWSLVDQDPKEAFALSDEGVLSFTLAKKTGTEAALGSAVIEAVSNYDGTTKAAVRINMVDASAPDSLEIVDESGYGFEGGTLALFEGGSGVTAQVFVNPTSKPQKAVWSVKPEEAVKILLPDSPEETPVSESAAKVLLKKGEGGENVVVTVTQDGVSASLSVSFPKADITIGEYEDKRWIEGETLTLTAADASFDIASIDGTTVVGNVWTVPAPANDADSEDKSLNCKCLSSYGESFTVSVDGKVYSSEHIRYDGDFFKAVRVFDFTSTGVGNLGEVNFKDEDDSVPVDWPTSAGEHDRITVNEDGSSFNVVKPPEGSDVQNKDIVVLPSIADSNWTLMMLEVKWSGEGTKPNMYVGNAIYGYSFYKQAQGKSFFLGPPNNWNPGEGSSYAIAPSAGVFNQYWVYDDGTTRSMRLNEESIYHATASFGAGKQLATQDAVRNMTFGNDQGTATFTIKTVSFYKETQ